jgi:hypothetical protein
MTGIRGRSRRALAARPALEALEARTVLSAAMPVAMPLIVPGPIPQEPRIPPLGPLIPVSSSLVVKVTTDKAAYKLGQPVAITLTETNTSNQAVRVLIGCQILNGSVAKHGATVWRFIDMRECATGFGTLAAHASRQFTLVWNGKFNIPGLPHALAHTGTFVVHAGVDGAIGAATIVIK